MDSGIATIIIVYFGVWDTRYKIQNVLRHLSFFFYFLFDPHVKGEKVKLKQHNIGELVPFLLNYLREKTLHHLTPRQSAALTPKKTSVSHGKGAPEKALHVAKGSSRGNVLPSQETPSPSPVTPLSQSRRDTPSSSPNFKRKSPKVPGNVRISPLVTQPKLNIDDPNDFPPMKSTGWVSVQLILILYLPISVCLISLLYFINFLWCW